MNYMPRWLAAGQPTSTPIAQQLGEQPWNTISRYGPRVPEATAPTLWPVQLH